MVVADKAQKLTHLLGCIYKLKQAWQKSTIPFVSCINPD